MTEPTKRWLESWARRLRVLRRWWAIAVIAVVAVLGTLYLALPRAAEYAAVRALTDMGAQHVSIGDAEIDLFDLAIAFNHVSVVSGSETVHEARRIEAQLAVWPLFDRRILVERLSFQEGWVTVVVGPPEGLAIPPFTLGADSGPPDAEWRVAVREAQVSESRIRYRLGEHQGEFELSELALSGAIVWDPEQPTGLRLSGTVASGAIDLDAQGRPFADRPAGETRLRIAGLNLSDLEQMLAQSGLPAPLGTVGADGSLTVSVASDGAVEIGFDGDLVGSDMRLDTGGERYGAGNLAWSGTLSYDGALDMDGTLTGQDVMAEIAPQTRVQATEVQWKTAGKLRFEAEETSANLSGELILRGVGGETDAGIFSVEQFNWQGEVALTGEGAMDAQGSASTRGAKLTDALADRRAEYDMLEWSGHARLDLAAGQTIPAIPRGRVAATAVAIFVQSTGRRVATVGSLEATKLEVDEDGTARAESIQLEQIAIDSATADEERSGDRQASASIERLVLDRMSIGRENVAIDRIVLQKPDIRVHRDKDGISVPALDALDAGTDRSASGEPEAAPEASTPSMRFRAGLIEIVGGGQVVFEDEALDPTLRLTLDVAVARIEDLDSAAPNQPSPALLEGLLGERGELSLEGTIKPFKPLIELSMAGTVEDVTVPALSLYAATYLGYHLKTGQLDADVRVEIKDGRIQGTSELLIRRLAVEVDDTEEMRELREALPVTLETAIELLRDPEGTIAFKMPLSGDVADPEFDLSDAINIAIGNAITDAIATTLKVVFPIAALIEVATSEDRGAGIIFKPVIFEAGKAAVPETRDRQYLETLSTFLTQRPGISITLCGVSTDADIEALNLEREPAGEGEAAGDDPGEPETDAPGPQGPEDHVVSAAIREMALALAERRASALKDYLMEEFGIDGKRLYVCRPKVSDEADSPPRVEMSI